MNSLLIGIIVGIGLICAVVLLAIYNTPQEPMVVQIPEEPAPIQKTWVSKYTLEHEKYPENTIKQVEGIENIKNYYKDQGISIFDVRYVELKDLEMLVYIPEDLNPPDQHRLYLLIYDGDVNKTAAFGYGIAENQNP